MDVRRAWIVAGLAAAAVAYLGTGALRAQGTAPAEGSAAKPAVSAPAQDPTAPAQVRLEGAWKNLKRLHAAGGFAMYAIDMLLIIGVAFIVERVARMRRGRILPNSVLKEVSAALEQGNLDALAAIGKHRKRSTFSRVLQYVAQSADDTADERDATVNEIASRDIDVHRMMCFPLAAIAGLAPLLGLLGTVVGIRECFRDVALAGDLGNPAMLAGGIEKALITTIYGLVVAIPTLFAYNLLKFRVNLLANELEEAVSTVLGRYASLVGKRRHEA